jgi:hypothetical protein
VTLSRIHGDRLRLFQTVLKGNKAIQSHHLYVWQMPIMLLTFSIWYLLIGLLILIYDRAAVSSAWGPDMKVPIDACGAVSLLFRLLILVQIAVFTGLATLFAACNYLVGAVTVYRLNSHLYSGKCNISVEPAVVQTSASWP